jgi:hypothetical protein
MEKFRIWNRSTKSLPEKMFYVAESQEERGDVRHG